MNKMIGHALLSLAIRPNTSSDQEKLARGVATLMTEDPTISVSTNAETGDIVIGGMGELHLEILVDRLKREFNVEANVGPPQIAYKETLTRVADGEGRYVRQSGGRGQYGHAKIRFYPGETNSGYMFANDIRGGAVPEQFFTPIEQGIKEALAAGILAGHPVDDIRVVLYDGSYHETDSSDMAFKIAGGMAFHDAASKAAPVVLEPVMRVEVVTPKEYLDDVMRDFVIRRGQMHSQEDCDGMQRINLSMPLSEMFGYASDLRSRTHGRGTFTMQFESYQPLARGESQDGDDSMVGAPRKPRPTPRDSSNALPEPEADD